MGQAPNGGVYGWYLFHAILEDLDPNPNSRTINKLNCLAGVFGWWLRNLDLRPAGLDPSRRDNMSAGDAANENSPKSDENVENIEI